MSELKVIRLNFKCVDRGIIIGKRIKGGTFRPVVTHIPSSTVRGCFLNQFGIEVKGFGVFKDENYEVREFISSPRDNTTLTSKFPIITQYLAPLNKDRIFGSMYILNEGQMNFRELKGKTLMLGAMKSKGFGEIIIENVKELVIHEEDFTQGKLCANIYYSYINDFKIKVLAPKLGYLIKGYDFIGQGVYKKVTAELALMEDSIIIGPKIFIKRNEETYYDE